MRRGLLYSKLNIFRLLFTLVCVCVWENAHRICSRIQRNIWMCSLSSLFFFWYFIWICGYFFSHFFLRYIVLLSMVVSVYVSFILHDRMKTFLYFGARWQCVMYKCAIMWNGWFVCAFFGYLHFCTLHSLVVRRCAAFLSFTMCLLHEYFPVWHAIHATIHFIINNCAIGIGNKHTCRLMLLLLMVLLAHSNCIRNKFAVLFAH